MWCPIKTTLTAWTMAFVVFLDHRRHRSNQLNPCEAAPMAAPVKCLAQNNKCRTGAEATNKREISQSSLVGNGVCGRCAVSGCQSAGKRCSNHSFLGIGRRRTCRWPPRTNLWREATSPARGISDQEAEKPYWRSTSVPSWRLLEISVQAQWQQ